MKLSAKFNFEIGDKVRTFILNMNSLCELEEVLGIRIVQNKEFLNDIGVNEMRAIAHCMLYKESPRPTVEDVGEWLSEVDIDEFFSKFVECISGDFGNVEGKKAAGGSGNQPDPTQD